MKWGSKRQILAWRFLIHRFLYAGFYCNEDREIKEIPPCEIQSIQFNCVGLDFPKVLSSLFFAVYYAAGKDFPTCNVPNGGH